MFGYLYDYDDDSNLKRISFINFNDGSSTPIAIPDKSLDSAYRTGIDQLYWIDGSNVVVFSPENQTQTVHPINSAKYAYTGVTAPMTVKEQPSSTMTMNLSLKNRNL